MGLTLDALKNLERTPPWEWPQGTGASLLQTLRDPGSPEEVLLVAAVLAGDTVVVNDPLVDALIALMTNRGASEKLRCTAAVALGPVMELADTEDFDDPGDVVTISQQAVERFLAAARSLYFDATTPKQLRRDALETSARAHRSWHADAVRASYASDDPDWRLSAVFCMRYVRGFDRQILESLASEDPRVHLQAVWAAGAWSLDAAWEHVVSLVNDPKTAKPLLLAAISAVGDIRPSESLGVLDALEDSDDPEIEEAVMDATALAGLSDVEDDDEEDLDDEEDDGEDEDGELIH